jgi:hypothetical protein
MTLAAQPATLLAVLLSLILLAPACAGRGTPAAASSDRSLISAEEMEGSGFTDAYSLIQALRPQWLRTRGATSINQREFVRVYVDDSLLGGPELLQQVTVHSIASIRHMTGLEATQRWGLDHGAGAIVIRTRR